jgi:hypothetical protein
MLGEHKRRARDDQPRPDGRERAWEGAANIGPNLGFQTKGWPHGLLPNALYKSAFASPIPHR